MTKRPSDVSTIIYTPQDAGNLALQMIDTLRKDAGGGVRSGIPDLDKILLPLRASELITVLGYTSHYKSGFMNWLSKQAIKTIDPEDTDSVVIRVTWEQSVEEDTISWLAGDANLSVSNLARGLVDESEWTKLNASGTRRAAVPMWIVGHSQQDNKERRRARPRMTMTDVGLATEMIASGDLTNGVRKTVRMVVLDYLQRIRPDPQDGDTKREQMMEAVNRAKDCAIAYGCPVVLGVQVGRQVTDRIDKTPRIDDGQETSNIEQSSDKVFSLWYPMKTEPLGAMLPGGVEVTKNLLILKLLKQKLGEAPATFALWVDPERNIIANMTKPRL
jgi:replicative DNA helicase